MKKAIFNAVLVAAMLLQSVLFVPASMTPVQAQEAAASETAAATDEPVIDRSEETGMVTFIGSANGEALPVTSAQMGPLQAGDILGAALNQYAPMFGIQSPAQELTLMKEDTASPEHKYYRYQQTYQGIPVMGGEIIVDLSAGGGLYSMSGEASPALMMSTEPKLTAEEAKSQAVEMMVKNYQVDAADVVLSEPELWIFDERLIMPSTKPAELTWRMEATVAGNQSLRILVLVNAERGGISLQFNQVDTNMAGVKQEVQPTATPAPTPTAQPPEGWSGSPHPTQQVGENSLTPQELGRILYVSKAGNDTNDCLSVSTSCGSIQGAMDKATEWDEIRIAAETYTSSDISGDHFVVVDTGVVLSGGWNSNFSAKVGYTKLDGGGVRQGIYIDPSFLVAVSVENFEITNMIDSGIYSGSNVNLTFVNDSIHGNTSVNGGGVQLIGVYSTSIFNTTIGGNHATNSGGGIYSNGGINLYNVTIYDNTADVSAGGVNIPGGAAKIFNTVIAGNHAPAASDCSSNGYFPEKSHNLIQNAAACSYTAGDGDITGVDASFGSLSSTGVYFIPSTSPAIDAGSELTPGTGNPSCWETDQLGTARPMDGDNDSTPVCDIGAYEVLYVPTVSHAEIVGETTLHANLLTAYGQMAVRVTDQTNTPMPGVEVIFTAPSVGASGTFANTGTATSIALTNGEGIAFASTFTANGTEGVFSVSAQAAGTAIQVQFQMENGIFTAGALEIVGSDSRSARINTAYSELSVKVLDQFGIPMPGQVVTFTAPSSGASGTFADTVSVTATATSNSNGVATPSVFTANGILGSFEVIAEVTGVPPLSIQMNNADYSSWYVSKSGSDSNICNVPDMTCATIQAAVDKATAGDKIKVSAETFVGSSDALSIVDIHKSLELTGGWNDTFTNQAGLTILDKGYYGSSVEANSDVTIERFWIRNAGAGITINTGANAIIRQAAISQNTVGIVSFGHFELVNSTISGNGNSGIDNTSGSISTVKNSTITGSLSYATQGPILLQNSIVAGNQYYQFMPCTGITSLGYNIFDPYCSEMAQATDIVYENPNINSLLTPLLPGGYHALVPGSAAIDGVKSSGAGSCEPVDQKGTARPVDGDLDGAAYCDIGAVEFRFGGVTPAFAFPYKEQSRYGHAGKALADELGVSVLDSNGLPVAGVRVTLTAPFSGASGTFPNGSYFISLVTDQTGTAKAKYKENFVFGIYSVIATVQAIDDPIEFTVTNGIGISTYTMQNLTEAQLPLPGIFKCDETDHSCTNGDDSNADYAQKHAMDTSTFYLVHHGWGGLDGKGLPFINSVHYGSFYNNAFWDGKEVVFGDDMTTIDTVGHELTHGVTDYTSGLFYYYQSGAISESFSDLWGEFIDQTYGYSTFGRWIIDAKYGPIRDMANPNSYSQPSKMTDPLYQHGSLEWNLGNLDTFVFDNGGVHTNSGVNNKAVYLMTDGDYFDGHTVTGIGLNKVAAIYFEAQVHLLTSGSDYKDLYYALQQACYNVVGGPEGVILADCTQVKAALDAVEMNLEPVPSFNPDAEVCPAGRSPSYLFQDGFETANSNWVISDAAAEYHWLRATGYAADGEYALYGPEANYTGLITASMANGVQVPATGTTYLYFDHAFTFEYGININTGQLVAIDGGILQYSVNGGAWKDAGTLWDNGQGYNSIIFNYSEGNPNPLTNQAAFGVDSHGYVSSRYNLDKDPTIKGNTIRFQWKVGTNDSFTDLGWLVDNVGIYTCQTAAATYTVSGTVANSNGPLSGVTISAGSGLSTLTGADGKYMLQNVTAGAKTITPSKTGYTFTPASRSMNVIGNLTGIDFTASNDRPVILNLSPAVVTTTSSTMALMVNGSNFAPDSHIHWGGVDRATTYVSSSQLYTWVEQAELSKVGAVVVAVHNPTTDPGVSNTKVFYTITFADVLPTSGFYRYVEGLYAQGVTGGCAVAPLRYCPNNPVTRAQMAVFLLKAKHGSTYVPEAATGLFGDVPVSHWAGRWIEQLAEEGITSGCSTGMYCPNKPVTRAQMAVFLLKAKHGSNYVPPAPTGKFGDVPVNHWAAAWIEQLAAEGITTGCSAGMYCPLNPVTRAQMAVFIDKAFGFPLVP